MEFRKYQHIERCSNSDYLAVNFGTAYVFPKIDGTNSSVWLNSDGELRAGCHKRELTFNKDNSGFYNSISKDERIISYLNAHPNHRLFGEWLVPHTLKTYRDEAWRKFYIFDVCVDTDKNDTGLEYLHYDTYKPLLEEFNLDYIAPITIIKNGNYDTFVKYLDDNDFLIKDGCGKGEGIVIKNYDYHDSDGEQTWFKIINSEFKERYFKMRGIHNTNETIKEKPIIEPEIVDKYVTTAFVEKEFAKIVNENNGWSQKMIPRLLSTIYHELICEEMWNIVKEFKNPTIDFKRLNTLTINKIKLVKSDIF